MSKQKRAGVVFFSLSWMSARRREEKSAPNDKRRIYTECLTQRSLAACAGCMQNLKCAGLQCVPFIKHGIFIYLYKTLKCSNLSKRTRQGPGHSRLNIHLSFSSLTFIFLKSWSWITDTRRCAAKCFDRGSLGVRSL